LNFRKKQIIVVLPSKKENLETFLNELVNAKIDETLDYNLNFIYPSTSLSLHKIKNLLILLFLPLRIISYLRKTKKTSIIKRLRRIYVNAEIMLQRNVSAIHYLFANNAIGRLEFSEVLGAKTSIGLRGYDITFYPINHPDTYGEKFWSKIDSIQYNSEDLYNWAKIWGANSQTPKTKITAAVNNEYIKNEIEVKVKIDITVIKLVFIGRLHWKKGIDSLFRVMELLRKDGIDFSFDIIGDGPEMEKCRFMAKLLGIEAKVILHGKLSQDKIIKILDECDVLVAPSLQEGCSNVVLEAQARGLYCVVSESEGMNEVVEADVTGKICKRFSDKDILSAILEYQQKTYDERMKIAKHSIKRIYNDFSRKKQLKEWAEYFENLCLIS
jgi:colanic acid/amylovoran biosynthesis glycosyltransferase